MLFLSSFKPFPFDICTVYILHQAVFCCLVIQLFLRLSFAAYLSNAVSVGLILWLAYHLATCVHSTLMCFCYTVCTVHKCAFVLYGMHSTGMRVCMFYTGFGYCFCLQFSMNVQSILIAYFHRCVQCTRYYWAFVTVIYLTCHNLPQSRCLGRITSAATI